MSKERATIIAAIIGGIFVCVAAAIGLGSPFVARMVDIYIPAITPTPIVIIQGQTLPTPFASPTSLTSNVNSIPNLVFVFYGYPEQGISKSSMALINQSGLSNLQEITFTNNGGELSPNGLFIAYDNCSQPNWGIYLAKPDGSNPQMVIPLTGDYCLDGVRWSPDSTKLSYTSQLDGSLRIFDIGSKSDTLIPNTKGADWHWWSPAGNEIVYGKSGQSDTVFRLLYITDLTGNNRQLTFANDFLPCERNLNKIDNSPAWSPDGNTIAFTQCESLFTISPTGNDLRQLTTSPYTSRSSSNGLMTSAYNPRWSIDGQWIIFIGDSDVLKRISIDGNTIVEIGKLPYSGGPFSIAPFVP